MDTKNKNKKFLCMINIAKCNGYKNKYQISSFAKHLAKKEAQKIIKRKFKKNISIDKIEILKNNLGKPILKLPFKTNKKIDISLSHCKNIVMAVAEYNCLVGCDVEKIQKFKKSLLREFLLSEELEYIENEKVKKRKILKILFWSLKESYLKAIGKGLIYHPKFVEFRFVKNNWELRDKGKKIKTKIEWKIFNKKYIITKIKVFI
jgi:4'-phosphopantetheinyl transferase